MKRWRAAFLFVLLSALPILFAWQRSPRLLRDSDTVGILGAIREARDPLKWFRGDWPLENHFYRPISSLVFELDNAIWHRQAAGYGLTNALLCVACVLLLFWLLREATDRPWVAASGASLFALWHVPRVLPLAEAATFAAWATLGVGAIRHRKDWRAYVPAFLTLLALAYELLPIRSLGFRMIDWIPGRTASTMTVFALAAMAAYARFERLRQVPAPKKITPETPPATRNTKPEAKAPGKAAPWAWVALVATALAMGSYEQGVMVPAALLVVALAFRVGGAKPLWRLHAGFWSLVVVYLGLRWALLPHTVSGYQHQQYSSTGTAFWQEVEYLFPALFDLRDFFGRIQAGLILLLTPEIYRPIFRTVVVATGYWQTRRETGLFLLGWLGSAVAFAPMAWFKIFEHYHYWPMALRTAFVVAMGIVALRLAASAWSPPARPAPRRSSPAPGSLPRP